MALDYLSWTGDVPLFKARYLKLATQAAEFFMHHFKNTSEDGRVMVWPAQVLESYWCTFDPPSQSFVNCCANDSPTISGMMTLFEKLLQLPPDIVTPQETAAWKAFRDNLLPALPLDAAGNIAPAKILSTGSHNSEGPELFAIHPHRVFTVGREVASNTNISIGRNTVASSAWAKSGNSGWNYGINAMALIGDSMGAAAALLERVLMSPAAGYRFPAFAPHLQDFDPSADHFANMNRALQEMLIQSGEDGFFNPTIVLFPAWPCEWDVSFKLWGTLNTTVEVVYAGGKLLSLLVEPSNRASSVKWASCI